MRNHCTTTTVSPSPFQRPPGARLAVGCEDRAFSLPPPVALRLAPSLPRSQLAAAVVQSKPTHLTTLVEERFRDSHGMVLCWYPLLLPSAEGKNLFHFNPEVLAVQRC